MTVSDAVFIINQVLPEPHAGLLAGMLFGARSSLSRQLHEALITTGTLHIVALSGMNISLLTGFVSAVLVAVLKRPIANLLAIAGVAWFIWFVGPSPSVIRAGIMGSIALSGVSFGRQIWPMFIWMLAVTGMLLLNPLWISDLSFQLSVMATLGILLFGAKKQPFETKPTSAIDFVRNGIRKIIATDLRVTMSAQLFTIPIIMFSFQRISLVSPLTNVLIGWLIPPIMVSGFLLVISGAIWMPLAQAIAGFVWALLTILIRLIDITSRIPFASLGW